MQYVPFIETPDHDADIVDSVPTSRSSDDPDASGNDSDLPDGE